MKNELLPIVEPLLRWFEENRRALPWREDREPYHVWISEIMLQQTRIEAVMRYYARFMDALPTVEQLSTVDDDTLLKLWEGLGYYSRARNLKKAAGIIMRDHGGVFPRCYEQLRQLPGIGDYTAGAIASLCFDERVPAVDGNVLRVITRVLGSRANVLLQTTKQDITRQLCAVIPEQAGRFNEGLMELGELICLPNGMPDCVRCPLYRCCTAYLQGLTAEIPVRQKELRRTAVEKTVFLIHDANGYIAIEKRDGQGLLSGMYQLPNIDGYFSVEELYDRLKGMGLDPSAIDHHKDRKHVFTHIDWYMCSYRVSVAEPNDRFLWVSEEELRSAYPLPTAFKKLL